jgi:iron complex transport system ATP-binding protein
MPPTLHWKKAGRFVHGAQQRLAGATPLSQIDAATFLSLQHVSVARGNTTVLHDVSLSIRRGERIAILGPNGCGKSTLIKTMTCELYPLILPGMHVEIFGRARWDLTELRRKLGVVTCETPSKSALHTTSFNAVLTGFFSSATLWPNLTVTNTMRETAAAALKQVGAQAFADRPLGELSAGQQKRVLIARALVGSGAVASERMLLLDEPSNALDLAAQAELRQTMRHLAQDGTGIILVTHHIADIVPEIDRVLFMRNGRIAGDGSRKEMLTEDRLSELFGVRVNLAERDGFLHAW